MRLYYVPKTLLQDCPLEQLVYRYRINALYMIQCAGAGHIGSAFSSAEIMTILYHNILTPDDIFFSSKGHDVAMQYAILQGRGILPFESIHTFRQIDGLPGHPDINITPELVANTGSLGMGLSKARGMAIAKRLDGKTGRIFVLLGDGELDEGQNWEALRNIANEYPEIIPIIDCNKISSDAYTTNSETLVDRFDGFDFDIETIYGNSLRALNATFQCKFERSTVIFASTTKGRGVSFMEGMPSHGNYKYHSGALSEKEYKKAVWELAEKAELWTGDFKFNLEITPDPLGIHYRELIEYYGELLVEHGKSNKKIVVLNADLLTDTGVEPFSKIFPDRFVECGIAEQDMVSVAGGLALQGKIPIVHSFAAFLTSRANEQIYNNCTEGKQIIYIGSMAGRLPVGVGVSHECRDRDIDLMWGMPNMTILGPKTQAELKKSFNWAINSNKKPTYIRLRRQL